MAIKQRKNGTFEIRVYVKTDEHKKKIFLYGSELGIRAAEKTERALKAQAENESTIEIENQWFSSALEKWMSTRAPDLSPSTLTSYMIYQKQYVKFFGERTIMKKITEFRCREYIAEDLSKVRKLKDGTTKQTNPITVKKHFFVLRQFFNETLADKSPMKRLEPPKARRATIKPPDTEDVAKLLLSVEGTDDEIIILLAAWCGMREGEIFALKPDDINEKANTISISKAMVRSNTAQYSERVPKSSNGVRTITTSPYIIGLLKAKEKRESIVRRRFFLGRPNTFCSHFIHLRKKANVKMRFHDLRHYHATAMFNDDRISDQYAAERLGHDIQTLRVIYQHLMDDVRTETDDVVLQLFQKK